MNLQNISFSAAGSNYPHAGKAVKANNQQNTSNTALSPKSSFDKMVESIQEQIQKIQENDYYDADTKKSKVEELEKQLKELQEAQRALESEVLTGTAKVSDKSNGSNTKTNSDGDTWDIGLDSRAFIEAGTNLNHLKNTYSMKKGLEGQSNVLKSEIKIDKSRGVNTTHKEEQLSKLSEGIERTEAEFDEAIKNTTASADEHAKRAALTNRNRVDGNSNSAPTDSSSSTTEPEPSIIDKTGDNNTSNEY